MERVKRGRRWERHRRRSCGRAVAGVVLGALASVSVAQDASPPPVDLTGMSLEQLLETPVVTGAAKRVQQQKDAAASVSVVTDEEINLLGHRHLADVLRNQRGFYLHT